MQFYSRVLNETRLFINQLIIPAADLPAEVVALANGPKAAYDKIYRKQMRQLVARTYFIGGIKSSIRTAPADLDGTVTAAIKLEQTENKNHESHEKSKINKLANLDDEQLVEENLDQEAISKINDCRVWQPFLRPKYQKGYSGTH